MEINRMDKLKSNKGFTLQDIVIGLAVLTIFATTIAGGYVAIYKVQCETRLTTIANLYAIQILENINRIDYDDVKNGMENNYKQTYEMLDSMDLKIEVSQYDEEDTRKLVKLTISYEFAGKNHSILLEELKERELSVENL